jgi:hypothetical protein
LKKLYGISQLTTVDAATARIATLKSTSFNMIQEYASAFKKQQTILTEMGTPIPPQILAASFCNGLDESLAPYVFSMIQGNRGLGDFLDIDNIVAGLATREVRNHDNDNKALAAKFGKQDKGRSRPNTNNSGSTSRTYSKHPNDRHNRKEGGTKRLPCPSCGAFHRKENCWYLYPELAPKDWTLKEEIQERIQSSNANKKKTSTAKASTTTPIKSDTAKASTTPAESNEYIRPSTTIKSLRNELTNTDTTRRINSSIHSDPKEATVYIDTASDVYIMWDRSKFKSYQTVDKTLSGIDGNTLRVLGIRTVRYLRIVHGNQSFIDLNDVHYVPDMQYNLLSVACLEDKGCHAVIKDRRFNIIDGSDGELLLTGTYINNSYLLDLQYIETPHAFRSSKKPLANHAS